MTLKEQLIKIEKELIVFDHVINETILGYIFEKNDECTFIIYTSSFKEPYFNNLKNYTYVEKMGKWMLELFQSKNIMVDDVIIRYDN